MSKPKIKDKPHIRHRIRVWPVHHAEMHWCECCGPAQKITID